MDRKAQLEIIIENIEDYIYVSDLRSYELKYISPQCVSHFGNDAQIGGTCWAAVAGLENRCARCPVSALLTDSELTIGTQIERVCEISGFRFFSRHSIVEWSDGTPVHLCVLRDITLKSDYDFQLMNNTDMVSGLFTRERGTRLLLEEFRESKITGCELTLCYIGFDDVREISRCMGRRAYEELIGETCGLISRRIRRNDLMYRHGGAEVVILFKCGVERAEPVIRGLREELHLSERRAVPFSYGLAGLSGYATVSAGLELARRRMLEAKHAR